MPEFRSRSSTSQVARAHLCEPYCPRLKSRAHFSISDRSQSRQRPCPKLTMGRGMSA
jgi:hypothetical protein